MKVKNDSVVDIQAAVMDRRHFVGYFSTLGLGASLMPGALAAVAQDAREISADMVHSAAEIAGISFSREEEERIAGELNGRRSLLANYERIRELNLGNSTQPAIVFNPLPPGMRLPTGQKSFRMSDIKVSKPETDEELAFLTVRQLSELVRTREITSTELTRLYLARLKKYDPILHCVVTLTEDLALRQAKQADDEIEAGRYRGPLHGIPWGAKDLLAVKGYRTTFGASPYNEQIIDADATVYSKLTEAGAVLVAKLSMGALAQGDRWFGGLTRSPWDAGNDRRGSSGSSAGPGSATAAGLVGFSIGTETRGSIISPSRRCGVSGLRPTFGRVSRHGAMALSWTMDKIGPMCRSAEDCALVLHAIHGPDLKDNSVLDVPFHWDATTDVKALKVGFVRSEFEGEIADDPENPERAARAREARRFGLAALETIRSLGVQLRPVELPELPTQALGFILATESAAAFDDLTRSERLEMLKAPPETSSWPNTFRTHRFVPAVDYIQANRARTLLIEKTQELFADLDLFIGSDLGLTNLTGHPEISIPNGFDSQGQPGALSLTGKLFGESEILLLAHAFQSHTDHHLRHPTL